MSFNDKMRTSLILRDPCSLHSRVYKRVTRRLLQHLQDRVSFNAWGRMRKVMCESLADE